MLRVIKSLRDNGFDGYIIPAYGFFILGGGPSYGLYNRALGVTYILRS
jgi:mannonate dehydratase